MNPNLEIIDFGVSDYEAVLQYQSSLFNQVIKEKKESGRPKLEYLLIGEHKPVITLGRHAKEENVLVTEHQLKERHIDLFNIGRGGDVTYHCPGQLIAYPILDLNLHSLGVKDYVAILEEIVIRLLSSFGIKGERIEGATGVWI